MANFGNYGSGRFNKLLVKDITVSDDVTISGDWSVTGNCAITGTFEVTSTSTFTGAVSIDDTTDTTSGVTGSLHTDGGIGIAKALYVGTTSALVGAVTVGSASGAGADVIFYGDTATADFLWDQDGDTNGSLTLGVTDVGCDFRAYGDSAGNYLHWDQSGDDLLLVGTATQLAVAGTTNSTTSTTGSLRTAGGLGVALNTFLGGTTNFGGNVTGGVSGTGVDVTLYGDTAGCDFFWDMNGATNTGLLQLGASATGVDFMVYGTTAATYLHWDHSADDLLLVGTATQLAVAGTTASTTNVTGSLRTAGGLGVALDAFIGGNLGLNTSASDIIVIADTAAALEVYDSTTKALAIDSRVTVTAVKNWTFTGMPATIASASGAYWGLAALVPGTTTFSGTTQITTPIDGIGLHISQPTLTDSGALTVDQASTVFIAAEPVAADALTLTAAYALEIASGDMLTAGGVITSSDTGFRSIATFVPDANRTDYALAIGGRSGGVGELNVANAASTNQNFDPIQMNFNIVGSNPSGSSQMNAIYLNVTHDTTDMSNYRIKGADWLFTVGKDVLDVYGAQKEIVFNAASITVGGEVAVHGMVLDGGSSAVTCAAWRVINATMRGSGTPADAHGIMVNAEASLVVAAGVRLMGAGMQTGIQYGDGSYNTPPVNMASFPAAGTGPCVASKEAGDGVASIKIMVGGVQKYLHYWDNAS